MASVLAQEEVDALLQGVASDDLGIEDEEDEEYDPTEVVPFDLTAQDRIIRGRMPTLEIIHDRFVRLFRLTLSNAQRKVVDIRRPPITTFNLPKYVSLSHQHVSLSFSFKD